MIATLFTLEHLSIPLPLNYSLSPPIYRELAALPDSHDTGGVLLELPTGWRNGARVLGRSSELIMMQQWYQTEHGRPRLGGNTSRNPAHKFQYFSEAPLLGDLIALMNADDNPDKPWEIADEVDAQWETLVARNRLIAPRVLDFLDVDYITLHLDEAPPRLIEFVEQALPVEQIDEWRGPNWRGEPSAIRLYRVVAEQEAAWQIDLADSSAPLHLAEGWSSVTVQGVRYLVWPEADLLVDVPDAGGTLQLDIPPPRMPTGVWLNGHSLTHIFDDGTLVVPIPPGIADVRVDRLRLSFAEFREPVAAANGLLVRSAGNQVGGFAHIFVDGVDASPNQRGYNLVALSPDGTLLGAAAFDTSGEEGWSLEQGAAQLDAMAGWLNAWPAGTIVAGAVADEASLQLSRDELAAEAQQVVEALARYGVAGDLRGRLRWSHAFIGTAGAPGEVIEELSLLTPATVIRGDLPAEAPQLWGSIGKLTFTLN